MSHVCTNIWFGLVSTASCKIGIPWDSISCPEWTVPDLSEAVKVELDGVGIEYGI
jgi:hypothetical protein